jgi:hypothetical protein
LTRYIVTRKEQPHFGNARSIRNALDRARLRQANRLVRSAGQCTITGKELITIEAADLLASRVFGKEAAAQSSLSDETESNLD